MADHGFDFSGILPDGTGVNIPLFLGGRPQFDEDELVATRRIATLRIIVEGAMERITNFQKHISFLVLFAILLSLLVLFVPF